MPRELSFTVVGIAQTKGSTRSFAYTPKAGGRPRVKTMNDNPKTKGWAQAVAQRAALALAGDPILLGPVEIAITFYLPRPKRLLTKKYAAIDVPHVTKPDADKLARAVKDALSGVVWHDDAQVTDLIARKRYARGTSYPRTTITVTDATQTWDVHATTARRPAAPLLEGAP